jgi:hypothetical protein
LTLAGLAGVRQRAKIDKTRSTIRKLHEIVVPQYESYVRRRVAATVSGGSPQTLARLRLQHKRILLAAEMPDNWHDVGPTISLPFTTTATMQAYARFKTALLNGSNWSTLGPKYEGAECLHMIVAFGGTDPTAMEMFRADEIGDIDGDGAPEFHDGWGRPIGFIRWPAGFESPIQPRNAATSPDPFDPMRVSAASVYPAGAGMQPDYRLVPLIYSPGPDEALNDPLQGDSGYGIQTGPPGGWIAVLVNAGLSTTTRVGHADNSVPGTIRDAAAAADNITNHDMVTK